MPLWLIILLVILSIFIVFLLSIPFWHSKKEENIDVEIGEYHMREYLASHIDNDSRLFNGVIIKNNKTGNTTEIDHIIISKKGIFVIETKDWKGIIHGDNNQEFFELVTMTPYQNIVTKIKNPIKQNMGHIKALEKILGSHVNYFNSVVFVRGSIKDVISDNVYTPESFIKFMEEKPNVLSIEAVVTLSNTLTKYLELNPVTHEEHVNNLNKRYNS